MRRPKVRTLIFVTGLIALIAFAAFTLTRQAIGVSAANDSAVPTAKVIRGSLELSVHALGELRASKSQTLSAPPTGGLLRLLTLVATGTEVRAGDVIMEFDPMEQEYALEQARSELLEADQEITKIRADAAVAAAEDQVTLLTARFDLRRAELDAIADRELIAANEYEKRQLSLDEAKRRLAQVEEDVKSRAATSQASLAVSEAKRTKSKMAADRAQQTIDSLIVKASIGGYVVAKDNRDASGGFSFWGMTLPEYRSGDNVNAGRAVVDIYDISHMEIRAKVNEQERNNVAAGQAATVESDALPGSSLTAKVTSVSGMSASDDFFGSSGPLREFDVTLELGQAGAGLRPGTTVRLVMAGTRVDNVLHIPRQAIFEKGGKPVVYLRVGDHFDVRPIQATHRTESRIAIEGLPEGAEVALVNPDTVAAGATKPGSSAAGASTGAKR
jgi:multidrug efflux pump subunit AcrA (membrane-fusion protein)